MAEFYVKKNKIEYKLSNGNKLVEPYNDESDDELKTRLNSMEETINFKSKFKPYNFSYINFQNIKLEKEKSLKSEIVSFIYKYKNSISKNKTPDKLILGINQSSPYKDKWFIYGENEKIAKTINDIDFKPYCARVDYIFSTDKVYLQYMNEENGKVFKEEFGLKASVTDDDILGEYLQ